MKLQIVSDLHIEFDLNRGFRNSNVIKLPETDADVIVLAGDIGVGFEQERDFCKELADQHGKPVVFILGNHSFYQGGNIDTIRSSWMDADIDGVHYLDSGKMWSYKGYNFVGGIFYTDFENYDNFLMDNAKHGLNDFETSKMFEQDSKGSGVFTYTKYYTTSKTKERFLTPARTADIHYETKEWMDKVLTERSSGNNIVITHHLPSYRSVSVKYEGSPLNYAFASNLDEWIRERNIKLWVHGHTHDSFDYPIGDTRVICNPRGYNGYQTNPMFEPDLVITV